MSANMEARTALPQKNAGPATGSRLTQAQRREQSERVLVGAAIAVVAEGGVSAATFETIGQKSGYSRSLVTQRFGSKQGLIDAVIAHLHERMVSLITAARIDEMPGLDAVLAYTDIYLKDLFRSEDVRTYFKLLSSAVADASVLRAAFAAQHEQVRLLLASLVRKGQAEGGIRRDIDADAAALMIGSLQLGISMQLLVDPDMAFEPVRKTSLAMLKLSFASEAGAPAQNSPRPLVRKSRKPR